jgi:cephalosporin hydroxylase
MGKDVDYKTAKGWLRPEERLFLHTLARGLRPSVQPGKPNLIVNIGVEYGASLACFAQGAPKAMVLGIDIDVSKNLTNAKNIQLIESDSGQIAEVWSTEEYGYGPIAVLFIDGDHSYEGVKRDIEFIKYVQKGGIIIFHDCYDFDDPTIIHRICPGVNQAVEEWLADNLDKYEEYQSVGTMRIFAKSGKRWF